MPTIPDALESSMVNAMFCICSTWEKVAYCAINSVLEVGSKGSWYFICATSSFKNASLSRPLLDAFFTELSEALSTSLPFSITCVTAISLLLSAL